MFTTRKRSVLTVLTDNMFNVHLYEKLTRNLPTKMIEKKGQIEMGFTSKLQFVKNINSREKQTGRTEQNH